MIAWHPVSLAAGLLGGTLLLGAYPGDEPSADEMAEAGALFRKSCASCHVPPDPSFEVDRAWLHQVADTA